MQGNWIPGVFRCWPGASWWQKCRDRKISGIWLFSTPGWWWFNVLRLVCKREADLTDGDYLNSTRWRLRRSFVFSLGFVYIHKLVCSAVKMLLGFVWFFFPLEWLILLIFSRKNVWWWYWNMEPESRKILSAAHCYLTGQVHLFRIFMWYKLIINPREIKGAASTILYFSCVVSFSNHYDTTMGATGSWGRLFPSGPCNSF